MSPSDRVSEAPWGGAAKGLVGQAAAVLAREIARFPVTSPGAGAVAPNEAAHARASPSVDARRHSMSESSNSDAQLGRVRLESRDAMDTVVGALSPNGPRDQQFPLVRCLGPVRAGQEGRAAIRVANDEETPSRLTLYCTNLAGDSGYDIASLRIVCSPRIATIRAKSEALFSVVIAVPEQTPPGNYCGLIQATGALYVKAVLSVQVI